MFHNNNFGEYTYLLSNKNSAKGVAHSMGSRCITDKFTISNQIAVPEICGTVTGQHGKSYLLVFFTDNDLILCIYSNAVYFDVSNDCNSLDFTLGSQAVGLTALATRQWSIKVKLTIFSCPNLSVSIETICFFRSRKFPAWIKIGLHRDATNGIRELKDPCKPLTLEPTTGTWAISIKTSVSGKFKLAC